MKKTIDILKVLLDLAAKCPEHPIYHPEKTTLNHIMLVCLKAIMIHGDPNMVLAAFLHDICKPLGYSEGMERSDPKESEDKLLIRLDQGEYFSNRVHAKEAAEFCANNKRFIRKFGADYQVVSYICENHMKYKFGKKSLQSSYLLENFERIDQNHTQIEFCKLGTKNIIPIFFVGMSEVDKIHGKTFTITRGRLPQRFPFEEIPDIIEEIAPEYYLISKLLKNAVIRNSKGVKQKVQA